MPWQSTRDAYRIWLSEIMLQQTQVATVLSYFARFVAGFPDVARLAAAPLARVLEAWSGLGYYRRAHHLHAAARLVVERHAGRFPTDSATLATLPGIGRTTAAAIAAFAGGERAAILDGNVKRVLARHRGIAGWPGAPAIEKLLWRIAEASLPEARDGSDDIGAYTQGLMDLGATVCTRTRPRCDACPVGDDCVARRDARIDALPSPRPRKAMPRRATIVLIVEHDGKVLLERRPPLGIWAGLWSFPEVAIGADVEAYLSARFGVAEAVLETLPAITHTFTHFMLTMHPVRARIERWPALLAMSEAQWFAADPMIAAAVPAPVRKLLASLERSGPAADASGRMYAQAVDRRRA